MTTWDEIFAEAEAARRLTLSDRVAGEVTFHRLMLANPDEGVCFYKRGEAYEALGELGLAAADYHEASQLFLVDDWRARAEQALERLLPD